MANALNRGRGVFPTPVSPSLKGKVAAPGGFAQAKSILIWYPDGRALVCVLACGGYFNPSPGFAERLGQSSVLEQLRLPEHCCRKMPHGAQQVPAWPGWSQACLNSPETAVGRAQAREGLCPSALSALL